MFHDLEIPKMINYAMGVVIYTGKNILARLYCIHLCNTAARLFQVGFVSSIRAIHPYAFIDHPPPPPTEPQIG